ncbi:unnamed protein product, partial [Discosporangium mesarthrocarpum]
MNRPDTLPFRKPVDHKAMGLHDYTQIIKNPMDLGTVKAKLEAGEYRRPSDAAADIRLIWDNCKLYNQETSEFGLLATSLSRKFEERYAKVAEKEKEREVGGGGGAEDKAPTLDEKIRFTQNLYRTTKEEVGRVMTRLDQRCPDVTQATGPNE